jgi:adenylate kinase
MATASPAVGANLAAAASLSAKHAGIRNLRLMFLGAPGVGKGTYAARMTDMLQMPYVSSGDLLRAEVAAGTPRGLEIKGLIDQGEFVSDAIVEAMVMDKVRKFDTASGFLLDGFPRNHNQAHSIEQSGLKLDWVINLHQPASVIITKLASRRVCPTCGFTYNYAKIDEAGIKMDPLVPKVPNTCDHCGYVGEFKARKDDREDIVRHRLEQYDEETKPLESYYEGRGLLVHFNVLGGAKTYMPRLLDVLGNLKRRKI